MLKREPKVPTVRLILILILLSGLFSAGLVGGASAASEDVKGAGSSVSANLMSSPCTDPTACNPVESIRALWKCLPVGDLLCTDPPNPDWGADWDGQVISWPSWSAYQTNARTTQYNSRTVFSYYGNEPLYPYMGAWADGCEITVISGSVIVIEWQRGSESYEIIPVSVGQTYTIDLLASQDGALIETPDAVTTPFQVSLANCDPEPIFPTSTPTHTATSTPSKTPTPTVTSTAAATMTRNPHHPIVPTKFPRQSAVMLPVTLITQSGSVNGSLSSLSLIEQTGVEDNPAAYIRFQTPGNTYMGYKSFALPANAQAHNISNLLLQVNFKGTDSAQVWTWSMYDWMTGNWVIIGNSLGTQSNSWNTLLFPVFGITRYISPLGEVRVRLQSDNASDDAKIDYTALHITYDPVVPTPTPAIPTAIPTRPRYSFPATHTPTVTP